MSRPGTGAAIPFHRRWSVALAVIPLLLAIQLADAPGAAAKRGLTLGIADNYVGSPARTELFDLTEDARAEMVRVPVDWRPIARTRPANPRDPADPSYDFSGVDAAVRAAQARGIGVFFAILTVPDWAEGPNRPSEHEAPRGTWDPDPGAFGDFAHALARRYSGSFPDPESPTGAPLPRVRHYEVWNEANFATFLSPQWEGGKPRSPVIYRRLLNALYEGVHAVRDDNVVIGGALAPFGDPPGGTRMRPLLFLRELFCLKGRKRLKPKRCPKVKLDVLSHHPINGFGGPRERPAHPDDATTSDMGKVRRILRAAEKGGNVRPRGRHGLWATEFWWPSTPPASTQPLPFGGVPLQKQARWIEEALYLFWKQGVSLAAYFQVRDPKEGRPTGLFFADDAAKPALQAFQFPFVTERLKKKGKKKRKKKGKKVRAWGRAPQQGELMIERRRGEGWKVLKRLDVGTREVFATKLRLRGAARLRARVGDEESVIWRQRG